MVVVMGWGGGDTKDKGEVAPTTCPNCHNQVFLHHLHSTKQFSLYFIPMGNYASNEYLACPVCRAGMQVPKEHLNAVQQMRAATSVFRRGGVSPDQYLAEVQRFWARIGVDASGRQVVGTPASVPVATPAPPAQVVPGSPAVAPGSPAGPAAGPSLAEQLRRLGELRADGILTDEEFAQANGASWAEPGPYVGRWPSPGLTPAPGDRQHRGSGPSEAAMCPEGEFTLATRRRVVLGAFLTTSILGAALAAPATVLAATVTVDTLADSNVARDGACSLREAIVAANLNAGNTNNDCADGVSGVDEISWAVSGTIHLGSDLPDITDGLVIDGSHSIVIYGDDGARPFRVVGGLLNLSNILILDGFAGGPFGFGGAISNGATLSLWGVTIRSSGATYGGAIHNNGSMAINASTIEGNSATTSGGAIYNEATLDLRNTTISANAAPQGAGIYSSGGTVTAGHVTIVKNTAGSGGGGGVKRAGGTMTLGNSIVSGNVGNQTAGSPTRVASLVQSSITGVIDATLRDNGGGTRTHRLPAGSPALSLGNQTWCAYAGNVDQRELARPSGSTSRCDAGAVQRDRTAPTMTVKPKIRLRENVALSGSKLRAWLLGWSATDGSGIGIERFSLQRQVNGGSWETVSTSVEARPDISVSPARGDYNVNLTKDKRYRFRIRAVDEDQNVSAWAYTPTVTARLFQQSNSRIVYSSGWASESSKQFYGGSVKYTTTAGRSVRMTFTGREFALVTTVRPQKLSLTTYTDGTAGLREVTAVDIAFQRQMFTQSFSRSERHVIRYVLNGPARLDVDAIAFLE